MIVVRLIGNSFPLQLTSSLTNHTPRAQNTRICSKGNFPRNVYVAPSFFLIIFVYRMHLVFVSNSAAVHSGMGCVDSASSASSASALCSVHFFSCYPVVVLTPTLLYSTLLHTLCWVVVGIGQSLFFHCSGPSRWPFQKLHLFAALSPVWWFAPYHSLISH